LSLNNIERRDRLTSQYNERIAGFVKNMLINPVKIQREAVINEKYDPDYRFKRSVRLDSQ
jgi:hypothetical protein